MCSHCSPKSCGIQVGRLERCWARFLPPHRPFASRKKAHGHRCFWQRILAVLTCLKFFFSLPGRWCNDATKNSFLIVAMTGMVGSASKASRSQHPLGNPWNEVIWEQGVPSWMINFNSIGFIIGKLDDPTTTGKNKTDICLYGCSCEAYCSESLFFVFFLFLLVRHFHSLSSYLNFYWQILKYPPQN